MLSFLAFIPWEAVPTWLETASPAAATAEAAGIAALDAVLAMPALLLGAGVLGWTIGSYLQKTFAPESPDPFPGVGGVLGGGTAGHIYRVTFEYETISGGPQSQTANLEGPIIGMFQGDQIQGTPTLAHYWWLTYGPTHQNYGPGLVDDDIIIYPHITGFVPLTTPDPSPPMQPYQYPPAAPVPEKLKPNIPLPFLPGSPSLPSEIVPFKRPNRTPGVEPLEPGEAEKPGVIVLIPGLGTGVEFTPDGIDVKGYNPFPVPLPDTQKDPRIPPPKAPPAICDCPCDLDEVLEKLKEIKDEEDEIKDLVTPPEYDYYDAVLLSGTGGQANLHEGAQAVTVQLVNIPTNYDGYVGNGGPDIYLAGWHAFGGNGTYGGVRTPIQYERSYFLVPSGAETFSFGVKAGYTAEVTQHYRVKRES